MKTFLFLCFTLLLDIWPFLLLLWTVRGQGVHAFNLQTGPLLQPPKPCLRLLLSRQAHLVGFPSPPELPPALRAWAPSPGPVAGSCLSPRAVAPFTAALDLIPLGTDVLPWPCRLLASHPGFRRECPPPTFFFSSFIYVSIEPLPCARGRAGSWEDKDVHPLPKREETDSVTVSRNRMCPGSRKPREPYRGRRARPAHQGVARGTGQSFPEGEAHGSCRSM